MCVEYNIDQQEQKLYITNIMQGGTLLFYIAR